MKAHDISKKSHLDTSVDMAWSEEISSRDVKVRKGSRRRKLMWPILFLLCISIFAVLLISTLSPEGRSFWKDSWGGLASHGSRLTGFLIANTDKTTDGERLPPINDEDTSSIQTYEANKENNVGDPSGLQGLDRLENDRTQLENNNETSPEIPTDNATQNSMTGMAGSRRGGGSSGRPVAEGPTLNKDDIKLRISGGNDSKDWKLSFKDDDGNTVYELSEGGRYNMDIELNGAVKKISFKDLVIRKDMALGFGEVSKEKLLAGELGQLEELGITKSFAIDPSSLEFGSGEVTLMASGRELYKCKDWDFEGQRCVGTWMKVMSIRPGEEYSFTITPDDPGFIETSSTEWDLGRYNYTRTDGENITLLNISSIPCTPSLIIPDVAGHYSTVDNGDGTWTTTFQPNATYGKDNFIYYGQGNNDNHGSCSNLLHGNPGQPGRYSRSLLWFNLSVLPRNATLTQSIFSYYIYQVSADSTTTNLYRLTQDWTEGTGSCTPNNDDTSGSTWNTYDGTNAWTTAGGSYNGALESQITPTVNTWSNHTVTSMISSQYNGTNPNYGFILISNSEGTKDTEVYSYSSDYATLTSRPKLSVTYRPRCYYPQGNYTSRVIDAGSIVTWDNITWAAVLPGNTNITLWTHVCDDASCSGEEQSWNGPFTSSPQLLTNNVSRYFQYKAMLNSSDLGVSPSLMWVTINYTKDSAKPSVAIQSISPNPASHSLDNVSVNWSASDLNLDKAYVNVTYPNGTLLGVYTTNFTLTTYNLSIAGNYNITVYANDTLGNWNTTSAILYVMDVLAPHITLLAPQPDSFQKSQTAIFQFNVSDASGLANCSLVINGGIAATNTTIIQFATNNFTVIGLPEEQIWWSINCTDNSSSHIEGNSTSRSLTIDITPPAVSLYYPGVYAWLNTSEIDFNYTPIDSNLDACGLWGNFSGIWKLNQTDDYPVSGILLNFSRISISDGSYKWNVICNDSAGNVGNDTNRTLNIDTSAPKVEFISPTPGNNSNLTSSTLIVNVSHAEKNPDTIRLYVNGGLNLSFGYTGAFTNFTLHDMADGRYSYYVWLNDSAGNTNMTGVMNLTIDTKPPTISLEHPSLDQWVTNNSVVFMYNVSDNLRGVANCSLIIDGKVNSTNHTIAGGVKQNFTVVIADTVGKSWSINCTDRGGLTNSSETRTVRVDTSFPVISGQGSNETKIKINSYICLNASVSDTLSGVNRTWAYILDPSLIPMMVELYDNHTTGCDGVEGDGVFSALLLVDKEGVYNWTFTYANDTAGNLNYTFAGLEWNSTTTGRLAVSMTAPIADIRVNESEGLVNYTFLQNCSVSCDSSAEDCNGVVLYARYNQSGFSGDITTQTTELVNLVDSFSCGDLSPGESCNYSFTIRSGYESGGSGYAVWCRGASTNFGSYISDIIVNVSINDHPLALLNYPSPYDWLHGVENLNGSASTDDVGIAVYTFELDNDPAFSSPSTICSGPDKNCTLNTTFQSQCSQEGAGCYLRLNVSDSEGLRNSTSIQIGIDNVAPILTLDRPPSWANITTSVYDVNTSVSESGSGIGSVVFSYRYNDSASWQTICTDTDGAPFGCSWDISSITEGISYQVGVYGNDTEGNIGWGGSHTNISIDRTSPNIRLEAPPDGNWSTGYINFRYNVSDAVSGIRNCSLIVDGQVNQTRWAAPEDTSIGFNSSFLTGAHTWLIECYDNPGNKNTSETRTFNIDYTGPTASIVQPPDYSLISGATYTLNASVYDPGIGNISQIRFLYRNSPAGEWLFACVDSDGTYPYSCSWDLSGVQDGDSYEIRVYANDTLNNFGENDTNIGITIDNHGPSINLLGPGNGESDLDGNLYFYYQVNDLGSGITNCSLYFNNKLNTTTYAPIIEGQTYNFSILNISNGDYYWNITCFDNFTTPRANTSETRLITVDLQYIMNLSLTKDKNSYAVSGQYGETASFTSNVSDRAGAPLAADVSLDIIKGNTSLQWWNISWERRRAIAINETLGTSRNGTVVMNVSGLSPYIQSCNEIRVVENNSIAMTEVPVQIIGGDGSTYCRIAFSANVSPGATNLVKYYVYYNNSAAPATGYTVGTNGTTIYDYWDYIAKGHTAYSSSNVGTNPPTGGPSVSNQVVLTSAAYGQINRTDDVRASVSASGYRAFRFDMKVAENRTYIKSLNVVWEGYTTRGTPYTLYVWNYSGSSWISLGSSTTTTADVNISSIITSGFSDLINSSGSINFVAETASSPNNQPFYTDYIKLNVNWDMTEGYQASSLEEDRFINRSVGQTGLFDGLWTNYWNVGGQQTGNYSAVAVASKTMYESEKAYTYFEIVPDSIVPNIQLLAPQYGNWSAASNVTFYYLPNDNLGGLLSCSLIINGINNQTNTSITYGSANNFSVFYMGDGNYNWSINCTDYASNENSSGIWQLNIDTTQPKINYSGGTAQNGSAFNRNSIYVNVSINESNQNMTTFNLYNSNMVLVRSYNLTDGTTWFNFTNLGSINSVYYYNAVHRDMAGNSNSTPTWKITLDASPPSSFLLTPHNFANISNSPYSVSALLSDTLSGVDTGTFLFRQNDSDTWKLMCLDSDSTGGYGCAWDVSSLPEAKSYEVLVYGNDSAGNIGQNSTHTNITIDRSPPSISLISPGNNTEWNISGTVVFEYIVNDALSKVANCSLIVFDKINGSASYNIAENTIQNFTRIFSHNMTYAWSINCSDSNGLMNNSGIYFFSLADRTPPSVELLNPPDNDNDPDGNMTFIFRVSDDYAISNCSLYTNLSGWAEEDILFNVANYTPKNFTIYDVPENISFVWNVVCFDYFGNYGWADSNRTIFTTQPPVIYENYTIPTKIEVLNNYPLVSGVTAGSSLTLIAGDFVQITCNGTVYDSNGLDDIETVNATLYFPVESSFAGLDNLSNHYSNASCTMYDSEEDSGLYMCGFMVRYYAANGTWICNMTGKDYAGFADTDGATSLVEPLYAIDVTPVIDYGELDIGLASASDEVVTIRNIGNMMTDLAIRGYGTSLNDGLSMNCSDYGNISIEYQKFSLSSDVAFGDMSYTLSTGYIDLGDFDLPKQNDEIINSTRDVYWKLMAPIGAKGTCRGTVIFSALG